MVLLANYYLTGKSTKQIFNYLKSNNMLEKTLPNVIVPHVYHLYRYDNQNIYDNRIDIKLPTYKITYFNDDYFFY